MNDKLVKFCIDAYKGIVTDYSNEEASDVIRKAFVDILGTETPTPREFEKHKNDIFAVIEVVIDRIVDESWEKNIFFNQFVEYKNIPLGDVNEFYVEDRTMLTFSEVAGGHWNLRRQKLNIGDTFTVKTRWFGAKVYTDFLRFLAGRVDWVSLVNKIQEAMKFQIATEIYGNFMGTMAYLPAEFKHSGSFSEDEMLDIIAHIQASTNYAPVVIAGTKKALKEMYADYKGVNSFLLSDGMKDQLNQYGQLDMWNGYRLLEIPQVHSPNTFNFMLDDKRLMILPANVKPIKFIKEGQTHINDRLSPTDNMDMSMEYTFLTKYGVATIFNTMYGMYELA